MVVDVRVFRVMAGPLPISIDGTLPLISVGMIIDVGVFRVMVGTLPISDTLPLISVGVAVGVGLLREPVVKVFITLLILPVGVPESVVEAVVTRVHVKYYGVRVTMFTEVESSLASVSHVLLH